MELNKFYEHILNGDAVLFCGAGFSYGAKNVEGKNIGGVKELIEKLKIETGVDDDELEYISEEYIKSKGNEKLIELLKNHYACKEPTDEQSFISELPWRRIYTTNYDNVIETACKTELKKSITNSDKRKEQNSISNLVIHINGSITKLNKSILESEFKLTKSSYLETDFLNSDWYELFKHDINTARVIIFIGYSMSYDLDIRRVMWESKENKEKVFFINGKNPTKKYLDIIEKFGQFTNLDSKEFYYNIKQFQKEYVKLIDFEKPLYSFIKYEENNNLTEKVTSKDVTDLIFYGDYDSNKLNQPNYIFERSKLDDVVSETKQKKIIVLFSEFGNGKTIFIEQLKKKLYPVGNIYELSKETESVYEDLNIIFSKMDKKNILIIENYNSYLNILKKLNKINLDNVVLILTARTSIHDTLIYELKKLEYLKSEIYSEYNLDILTEVEMNNLVSYFEEHKIWGTYSNLEEKQKKKMIKQECKKKLNLFLLKIFEKSEISKKLETIINILIEEPKIKSVLILVVINNILNLKLSYSDILSVLNLQNIKTLLGTNDNFKEIFDVSDNKIKIGSSIVSLFILKRFKFNKEIVDLMIELMKKNDNLTTEKARELKFTLISFSNFQLVVQAYKNNELLIYYEKIKNLNYCSKNPYFWIQYANAVMSIKDYERAKLYLDSAYSHGKGRELYQYDSCYARFLLESQMHKKDKALIYSTFKTAHDLLLNNKNEIRKWHFPIKQVELYIEYWEIFKNDFIETEKALFILNSKEMISKIEEYCSYIEKIKNNTPHFEVRILNNLKRKIDEIVADSAK